MHMHYMHYKDYIHHDFLKQQSAWLLRKPPLPATGGRGEPSGWGGRGVWGSLLIYTNIQTYKHTHIQTYTHTIIQTYKQTKETNKTNKQHTQKT